MNNLEKDRIMEIEYIYELLQEVLKEKGYVIPYWKFADEKYKGFEVELRNKLYENDKLLIKIEF